MIAHATQASSTRYDARATPDTLQWSPATDILDAIDQLGFRRWYRRKLIEAHAWLVSGVLSLVLAASLFEMRGQFVAAARIRLALTAGSVVALAGVAYAWRKYRRELTLAERMSEIAACPGCNAYGRFTVLRSRLAAGRQPAWMNVRCSRCGREWRMEAPL